MDYLGIGPGDPVAFVLTDHGVLVEKFVVLAEVPPQKPTGEALREIVLAIGRDAQAQGLSEEDVEQDID